MSTRFFERPDAQRSSRWLVPGFIVSILSVVAIIDAMVLVGIDLDPMRALRHHPELIAWLTVLVPLTILIASWHKAAQLRHGGGVFAKSIGAVHVLPHDPDFARQRLLDVVDEMTAAARVRKPMVFVLPDELAINAFVAGNSPDEAAITVTQGALDRLGREQLRAVIAHEFSHMLDGDLKTHRRLTSFVFGLFVVTNIALRLMNPHGRKPEAWRYPIALVIFIAGSLGLFAGRLLQSAVARRREHLADASAAQFLGNPQALQGAFVAMAAHPEGTRLVNTVTADFAHMFIANSDASWAGKFGGSLLATHPALQERVQALDGRVTPLKFRTLVSDEKRRPASPQSPTATAETVVTRTSPGPTAPPMLPPVTAPTASVAPVAPVAPAEAAEPTESAATSSASETGGLRLMATAEFKAPDMQETLPSGIRKVGGRSLPPDVLRNRLSADQQSSITALVAEVEASPLALQATLVAAMLATEPAKWRTQLVKLAPALGVDLMKATQAQLARFAQLAPAARMPALSDLLTLLDGLDAAERKRLRAVARAFAPTVAIDDRLRFGITRVLERKLATPEAAPTPVPLPERASDVCTLYAALAQCRYGAGKQGTNAYRAGVMGMMPAKMWAPYPEEPITNAQLDASLAGLALVHPTGRRSFSEGMARVLSVGGHLTVPQVDLLRATCLIIDCALPMLPIDVVYEDSLPSRKAQASAR